MSLTLQTPPAAGFTDPVGSSQQTFRALLDALSRPGHRYAMPLPAGHPTDLTPALAAALLCLCDYDSPLWLGPGMDNPEIAAWLRFHTGVPLLPAPDQAAFALLHAAALPALTDFAWGSDLAPEQGATLLIQAQSLSGATMLHIQGPGLAQPQILPDCGLPRGFWQQRAAMSDAYPRGLEIYIAASHEVIGLPRSTRLNLRED